MKPKFIKIALFTGSFFLIQTANAQFDTDKFSERKPTVEHSNLPAKLLWGHQLDSTLISQDALKKAQSRLLTPNIAWPVKNKGQNISSVFPLPHATAQGKNRRGKTIQPKTAHELSVSDLLYQKRFVDGTSSPASTTEKTLQLNKGSVDPGIFYAPDEKTNPAAIIIKPLKNLDPEMVVNPDRRNY
ncbi:MAG: hypothetical protein AB8G77_22460 [Rhodothermales bacterium]